jgi:hypothetical protein
MSNHTVQVAQDGGSFTEHEGAAVELIILTIMLDKREVDRILAAYLPASPFSPAEQDCRALTRIMLDAIMAARDSS